MTTKLTVVAKEFAWEQKYRPDNLDEVILPHDVRTKLKNYVSSPNVPSFLFYSPQPGTGKTTTAYAVAFAIGCLKPLFINASIDNSIDDVRDKVFQYSTGASVLGGRKIVILDEVERLSAAAQDALKGLMEKVSKVCSFILTTNNKSRVIEPLRSRCQCQLDFVWGEEEAKQVKLQFMGRCVQILDAESITYDKRVIFEIVNKFFPDNRRIIGKLQESAVNYGAVDERALAQISSGDVGNLITMLKEKDFASMKQWVADNQSYITEDFYSSVFKMCVPMKAGSSYLVENSSVPDLVAICGQAQTEHRLVGDLWLHGVYFLTNIMMSVKWK